MRVIDISRTISPDMEMYPGDTPPKTTRISRLEQGDPYNLSRIVMGTHTGTHVDPPLHFIKDGAGIDEIPLEMLACRARVLDLSRKKGPLEPSDIALPTAEDIVLLKGGAGGACLGAGCARYLADNGIMTVGTDALSIGAPGQEHEVHNILLGAGIVIVEGLELSAVEEGDYLFVCLPLKIAGGDGGPARAVLIADI